MLTLYDFMGSGNGYKVRLLLAQLGIPYELVECDILKGETRTPEFLAKNPNGRIPTLQLEDGTCLAESGAILWYLAEGTKFVPEYRLERAQTLQWMFFEQNIHEPNVAGARFLTMYLQLPDPRRADLDRIRKLGYDALGVMESHLAHHRYFVGERYSIADIALYAYTHVAPEGGFDLARFPSIRHWIDRVKTQPRLIPITQA